MNQRKAKKIRQEVIEVTEKYTRVNSKLPQKGLFRRLYGNAKTAYNNLPRKERNKFEVI